VLDEATDGDARFECDRLRPRYHAQHMLQPPRAGFVLRLPIAGRAGRGGAGRGGAGRRGNAQGEARFNKGVRISISLTPSGVRISISLTPQGEARFNKGVRISIS
jgi:hypothetical protein